MITIQVISYYSELKIVPSAYTLNLDKHELNKYVELKCGMLKYQYKFELNKYVELKCGMSKYQYKFELNKYVELK